MKQLFLAAVSAIAVSACVRSSSVQCGERTCPADTICNLERRECLLEEQTTVCLGRTDGGHCVAGNVTGICDAELCLPGCGDGISRGGEQCDDANFLSHDGCSSACLLEAPTWTEGVNPFGQRRAHVAAYHQALGRVVIVGGFATTDPRSDMWERDATGTWQQSIATLPARNWAAGAYDIKRGVLVIFGGRTDATTILADTWEYSQTGWKHVITPSTPSPRYGHAMAYDENCECVVMFGGFGSTHTAIGETWQYDGTTWTAMTPAVSPSARGWHAMMWHPGLNKVVAYGGYPTVFYPTENRVWEYASGEWSPGLSSGTPPPNRHSNVIAYSPPTTPPTTRKLIMFGGATGNLEPYGDTWEWDHQTGAWTLLASAQSPARRWWTTLTSDGARLVLVGGSSTLEDPPFGDVWEFNAGAWRGAPPRNGPSPRVAPIVYSEQQRQLVSFGGFGISKETGNAQQLGDTWVFSDDTWRKLAVTGPPARIQAALAYDRLRDRTIVFGGASVGQPAFNDTWEWNGALLTWTQRLTPVAPSPRYASAVTFDDSANVTILFGGTGTDGTSQLGDTWELGDAGWELIPTTESPAALLEPSLAYDPDAQRSILVDRDGVTWAYANRSWSRLDAESPGGREGATSVFDPLRRRIVLYGGTRVPTGDALDDVWEFDGTNWLRVGVVGNKPVTRAKMSLAAYPPGRSLVLFGGQAAFGFTPDPVWFLKYGSATPDEICDNAEDDDGDKQVDAIDPDCGV